MTPHEVLQFFGNQYQFHKRTKMARSTLVYWLKLGYIPEGSQYKIERLTNGLLKSDWSKKDDK